MSEVTIDSTSTGNSFKIVTTVEISDGRIQDLLIGAFEGGSNYWYNITEFVNPNDENVQCKYSELPLIEGCGVMVGDIEDEETEPVLLDYKAIAKGLQVMNEKYNWHMKDFLNENDDATTADVFLQCCLFGEIVFG